MSRYLLEALLRPPVEFYSAMTALCAALICLRCAPLLMLTAWQSRLMVCALMLLALRRVGYVPANVIAWRGPWKNAANTACRVSSGC